LDITVSGGARISAVTGYKTGESTAASPGYGIFPGTIDINDVNGHVNSWGTPVSPAGKPGSGPDLPASHVVLELGSLYDRDYDANAPAVSGKLCSLTIDCNTQTTNQTITTVEEDIYRGGIVLEDGNAVEVTIAPLTFTGCLVTECLKNTATEYAARAAWGKPNCWCFKRQCRGDADGIKTGLYWVAIPDLNLLRSAINKTDAQLVSVPNGICADFDHVKTGLYRAAIPDLNILRAYINKTEVNVPCCDLDTNCVLVGGDKWNFWTN
jgi:hypothetical protein